MALPISYYFSIQGEGIGADGQSVNESIDSDGDGMPDLIEIREGTNQYVKDNDVLGNNRHFVMQMYRSFLMREGEES